MRFEFMALGRRLGRATSQRTSGLRIKLRAFLPPEALDGNSTDFVGAVIK